MKIKKIVHKLAKIIPLGVKIQIHNYILLIKRIIIWFFHYRGKEFYCPCCGYKLKKWMVFNPSGMENYIDIKRVKANVGTVCPVCQCFPRHRIIAYWLTKEGGANVLKNGNFVFFAPDSSLIKILRNNKISFKSADLFNKADLKVDIQNMDFNDESIGAIMCNHVLEHVEDYRRALKEIYRVLKKNGTLICTFPYLEDMSETYEDSTKVSKEERIEAFGQYDHCRIFGRDIYEVIKSFGFDVNLIQGKDFPKAIGPLIGPADYDSNIVFVCTKK